MSHFHMGSDPNFGISAEELEALIGANNPTEALDKKGGIEGLADALHSGLEGGISGAEVSGGFGKRKKEFGENKFPEPKVPSIFALWWDAYKDEMIIILTVAAVVSLVLGLFFEQDPDKTTEGYSVNLQGGIEGVAILGAIIIVTTVQALNNYSQEKQFQSLNKTKNDIKIKVIRGGEKTECQIGELVVGDVVVLDTGNQVPADGFYISGYNCQADESNMTGESEPSKKSEKKRQMLSGCHVTTGDCTMMVTAVGTRSLWGKALKEIDEASDRAETPLQKKLGLLARNIGFLGLAVAGIVFVVLCIYYVVGQITSSREDDYEWEWSSLTTILEAFITAVTIVVVAVPEGLPLAVTIALAFSMKKMMKDNNLVRHLPACETMGGATQICSDKTGTLTQNRMHVTAGMVATERFTDPNLNNLNDTVHHLLTEGLARNTTSYLKPPKNPGGPVQYIGQPTECALLAWINKLNVDYEDIRKQGPKITQRFPFSSARKRMSCVLPVQEGGYRMYTKGASEIILKRCTNILNKDGGVVALDSHTSEDLMQYIEELASRGLRTIGVAYRDFEVFDTTSNFDEREEDEPPEMKLTLIAIAGIEDPVRPEVPDAVKTCQQAGITVRMVTGDNILTARSIAKQCNILTEGGQAIEGPEFAKMSDEQIDAILPKLQVLARSSPSDKIRLVKRLRANSELVAVTGDGTNDAPALKGAHVGLAMGSGTEVAREASDIIILDDNFSSIVKSVMWGRCVFDNIRKFLVFQLTVNVAALCIAALAALVDSTPLTAVQLLWVNLIMDSFGALALATEPPTPALLQRPPLNVAHKKTSLISPEMWKMILGSSAYQVAVLMGGLFGIRYIPYYHNLLYPDGEGSENPNFTEEDMEAITNSIVFNAFIYCQVFNLVACRKVNPKEYNPFKGFFHNIIFFVIFIGIGLVQILLVGICIENPQSLCTTDPQRIFGWLEWIGVIFDTVALGGWQWLACIGVGFGGFIWSFILRLIPVCDEKRYKGDLNDDGDEDGSDDDAGEHKSLLPKGSHDNF